MPVPEVKAVEVKEEAKIEQPIVEEVKVEPEPVVEHTATRINQEVTPDFPVQEVERFEESTSFTAAVADTIPADVVQPSEEIPATDTSKNVEENKNAGISYTDGEDKTTNDPHEIIAKRKKRKRRRH